jgi:ATP-dependent DNA helicase PIF1
MGPFCGIMVIVTGDPRQQLPISPGSNEATLISLCFHSSYLFDNFEHHHLIKNVRIHHTISFMHDDGSLQKLQEWILMVGDGVKQKNDLIVDGAHFVRIPQQFYCGDDIHHLADRIYGDITSQTIHDAESFFADRIILSPLYRDVQIINNIMIQKFAEMGAAMVTLKSNDMVTGKYGDEEIANDYSASCFPEHNLTLFVGCPVMVLRKYSGQVNNGDRAVVDSIASYRLGLRMLTGTRKGQIVHLPRMLFKPSREDMRLEMQRLQFGVVASFGITVSKSQSCGFKRVGIWIGDHFFAHGHLYLAMSRLQVSDDGDYSLLFASRNNMMSDHRGVYAKNIVYDAVLSAYK